MVFPLVMYGCESWTIKKAEHQRTDTFELWCWRKLLRVPWNARLNQSILKEINLEYSLEGLMLRLKPQYFGHIMGRANSLQKTMTLGKIKGRKRRDNREWDGWMASPTQWTWVWASSRTWWRTGKPGMLQSMGLQSRTWISHWTATTYWQILLINPEVNIHILCYSMVMDSRILWLTIPWKLQSLPSLRINASISRVCIWGDNRCTELLFILSGKLSIQKRKKKDFSW